MIDNQEVTVNQSESESESESNRERERERDIPPHPLPCLCANSPPLMHLGTSIIHTRVFACMHADCLSVNGYLMHLVHWCYVPYSDGTAQFELGHGPVGKSRRQQHAVIMLCFFFMLGRIWQDAPVVSKYKLIC